MLVLVIQCIGMCVSSIKNKAKEKAKKTILTTTLFSFSLSYEDPISVGDLPRYFSPFFLLLKTQGGHAYNTHTRQELKWCTQVYCFFALSHVNIFLVCEGTTKGE